VAYITKTLQQYKFKHITLQKYKLSKSIYTGWFRILAIKNTYRIYITELILDGLITKYSYTFLYKNEPILRYDNSPHHPHLKTHPHHKHIKETIKPLQKPTIEEFIKEVKQIFLPKNS